MWVIPFLILMMILAYYTQKEAKTLEDELKREEDRRAKIKSLYPDPPPYEERMGVKYGPKSKDD